MGPLAKFLLALTNLVRSGAIKKIADAIKFAKQEFGEITPLLRKQIERIFEQAKKPVVGKPGKKEGVVIPMVKEGAKKTEGIETLDAKPLDEVNLSDDAMDDLEKILRGEGDTGKPSQFTDKDVEEAIDNVSPGFVSGDTKYNAELVAEELAESKGIDYDSLSPKDGAKIYGRALDGLQKFRMKKEVAQTDKLIDFFKKEIDKAEKSSGKFEGVESTDNVKLGIENLKNPRRPGGPLDPVQGVTRTITRRILDRKGIKINKGEDPIDVFINNFGIEIGTDVQALADDIVEAERTGRNLKPLDDLIEMEGLFDIKVNPNPNPGIPTEEMIEKLEKDLEEKTILEDFDITGRDPNAKGGRVGFSEGGGKDMGKVVGSTFLPDDKFSPKDYPLEFRNFMKEFGFENERKRREKLLEMFEKYMQGQRTQMLEAKDGGLMRTKFAIGSDDEPLKPDPTKPINPFQPTPTGPVLPDKSMMASYGYDDAMAETFAEFQRLKKLGEIPADMEFDEYLDLLDIDIPLGKKQKQAPSIKLAEADYDNIMKLEDKAMQRALDAFQYYRSMGGKLNFRDYLKNAGKRGDQFRGAEGGLAKIINL